jgi:hypothetical protein
MGERLEIWCPGHEVGFTVDLDEGADPPATVNVGLDQPLQRTAVGFLPGTGETLLAKDLGSLGSVAVGFHKRAFGIHDPGASVIAKFANLFGGY